MEVKVSSKGQIVIPRSLRKKYEIERGTMLKVSDDDGQIQLIPPVKLASMCGSWDLDRKKIARELKRDREDSR